MTGTELMDFAARLCGIATITGVLTICGLFQLYRIEDRQRGDDDD